MKPTFETVLEELEAALARAERAEAREATLSALVTRLMKVLSSHAGALGSDAETSRYYSELADECAAALASPSPVAEAMGRVVEAVEEETVAEREDRFGKDRRPSVIECREARRRVVDALLAARKGEG